MKNKLLISLLIIITSYLTYSLFFKSTEINYNSANNSSTLSNDTPTSPTTIQKSTKTKENPSTVEEINYNSSKNSSVLSDDTPTQTYSSTVQKSPKTKENPYIIEEKDYNSSKNTDTSPINIPSTATIDKKTIEIPTFLTNLPCTNYVLNSGETLTDIARKYENSCNLNTSIKLIKSINKFNDGDNINSGLMLSIPESLITTGTMHPVIIGDTWYNIVQKHYNAYDVSSITKFLVYINDLPNNDLPLGESIFLPSL